MALLEELIKASNPEIGTALAKSYRDIGEHYLLRKWKYAGLDSGHFVEAARRFLELKLFGAATPIENQLSNFNDTALSGYLNAEGDIAYRMLIPKTLWAIYALRNKRSIGHLAAVPANEIDIALLLNGAKWVIAEILRLESTLGLEATRDLVSSVISSHQPLLWKAGDAVRVLNPKIEARDQVLILLTLVGSLSEDQLQSATKYKNPTNFRKILRRLDASNLIEYSKSSCEISPTGVKSAEALIESNGGVN